jgi:cytosine/adenosine deaminase-related metal-dependent hydrolase
VVKTGIAHCPSSNMRLGAGACRVEDLLRAGARVGLGVDGSASNEDANLAMEVHQALLLARVRNSSPRALDARAAWRLATQGGADCLGRADCGMLEPGKCADIACFRVDDLGHAGIKDLVAGLALAPPSRAQTVVVNGRVVVQNGRLLTGDEEEIAREIAATSARLAG